MPPARNRGHCFGLQNMPPPGQPRIRLNQIRLPNGQRMATQYVARFPRLPMLVFGTAWTAPSMPRTNARAVRPHSRVGGQVLLHMNPSDAMAASDVGTRQPVRDQRLDPDLTIDFTDSVDAMPRLRERSTDRLALDAPTACSWKGAACLNPFRPSAKTLGGASDEYLSICRAPPRLHRPARRTRQTARQSAPVNGPPRRS